MGYYTTFHIKAIDLRAGEEGRPKLDAEFFNSFEFYGFAADEELWAERDDGTFAMGDGESYKWYEHEEEMREASRKHPDIVFILDGYGEEAGDLWREFWLNGKLHAWEVDDTRPELDDEILNKLGR